MDKKDKIAKATTMYGYIPILIVRQELEEAQDFEMCQQINEILTLFNLPTILPADIEEDYRHLFWRIGYSGDTALINLAYYVSDCRKILTND